MTKLTLSDIANLQNENTAVSLLNANSALIETAMENTLSRDGTSPNQMTASLDMNSNRIINLPEPAGNNDPIRLQDVESLIANIDPDLHRIATDSEAIEGTSTTLLMSPANTKASIDDSISDTISVYGKDLVDSPDASSARTTLGLGTAAVKNTGTSGNTVPLLDGANTWASTQNFLSGVYSGTNTPQYNSFITVRIASPSVGFEFGHPNTAGYGSTLGGESTSGKPYLAFNSGPGTNNNTYKTLGIKGSIIRSDLAGGFEFVKADTTSADNQTPTTVATLSNTGVFAPATAIAIANGGTGATTASGARTNLGLVPGTDVQAFDSDLSALAANSTNGLWARTGAGTGAARTITAPAAGITVSNGDGVAGNPTLALANDLSAVEGLAATGLVRRTATDTWSAGTTVSTTEVADNAITYAKMQDVSATNKLLGRSSSGSGDPEEIDIGAWSTYTPTVSPQSGAITTSSASGRYKIIGKLCFVQIFVSITTAGTGTGGIIVSMPPGVSLVANWRGALAGSTAGGLNLGIIISQPSFGNNFCILKYDATTVIANGQDCFASGVFEIA